MQFSKNVLLLNKDTMGSKHLEYDELLKHQNILRIVNRRLLQEICPSSFQDNLDNILTRNKTRIDSKPSEKEKNVSHINKNTQTESFTEASEEDCDDGYKSGPVDSSEETEKKEEAEIKVDFEDIKLSKEEKGCKKDVKVQSRRPASASLVQTRSRNKSPYHIKCKPDEPDRRFIALPFPSNLYQSDRLKIGSKFKNSAIILVLQQHELLIPKSFIS